MNSLRKVFLFYIFRPLPVKTKKKIVDFILKLSGIEISEAISEEDKDAAFRLRYEVYLDEEYITESLCPDHKLTDKYEDYSTTFVARKKDVLVGTVRMVQLSNLGLPIINACTIPGPLDIQPTSAEISKLCILRQYRKGFISIGLLLALYFKTIDLGLNVWFIGTSRKLGSYFENIFNTKMLEILTNLPDEKAMEERGIIGHGCFTKQDVKLFKFLISSVR